MDKLTQYREIIKRCLDEFAAWANRTPSPDYRLLAVFDQEHDYYLLLDAQWGKFRSIRSALVFIRLYDDKIYIEEDWTEEGIVTGLLKEGVPTHDIVMGFHSPELRPLTEFAAA